jgi:hypothetical protein
MSKPIPFRPDPGALNRSAMRSLARSIWCLGASKIDGTRTAFALAAKAWPEDRDVEAILKSAVSPADTTSGLMGFAQILLTALKRPSAAADLIARAGPLTWPEGTGTLYVPGVDMSGVAAFVGESAPVPVGQGISSKLTLAPHKLMEITSISGEMLRYTAAAEMIEDSLTRQIGARLDALLFSTSAGTPGIAPPGLLNGIAPLTPTLLTGNPFDQVMFEDLAQLAGAVSVVSGNGDDSIVIIAASKQASFLRLRLGNNPYYPVLKSDALAAGTVIAAAVPTVAFCARDPRFEQSSEVVLHMEDTTPAAIGTPGTPNVVAAPARSMWQTDSSAIRFSWPMNWGLRDARGIAFMSPVNW